MKKLVSLLLGICILGLPALATAQTNETFMVTSQRYKVPLPEGWYATDTPYLLDLQPLFPTESLTLADTQGTLDTFSQEVNLDSLIVPDGFTGAMIFSTVWPAGLLEAIDADVELLGSQVNVTMGSAETTSEDVSVSALTGTIYKHAEAGIGEIWFALFSDKADNLLMMIGVSDNDQLPQMDSIFHGVEYSTFAFQQTINTTALPSEIEILPDIALFNLPAGWWTMSSDDIIMTMPTFNFHFVESFQTEDFDGQSGIVMMALPQDKDDLPPEVYNDDGTLNPDGLTFLMNLGLTQDATNEDFEGIAADIWTGQDGTSGFSMEMEVRETGIIVYMVVFDAGDKLATLFSMVSPDLWEAHRNDIEAILATTRRLE